MFRSAERVLLSEIVVCGLLGNVVKKEGFGKEIRPLYRKEENAMHILLKSIERESGDKNS
jgi:hypothetical protein